MGTKTSQTLQHDTARVAGLIGNGISKQVIRRWARNHRFGGFQQHEPNAKLWVSDEGVLEVWSLWAEYQDLDPEKDMPAGVRKVKANIPQTEPSADPTAVDRLTVTIVLPAGAHLQVVQQG